MAGFRLVEYGRTWRVTWAPVYPTALEAVEAAEQCLAALEDRPARRPYRFDVVDLVTGEGVTRVVPKTGDGPGRDGTKCVACGQPLDPFAGDTGLFPAGDTGSVGPGPGFGSPLPENGPAGP